jgi:chaperone BCS1
MTKNSKGIKADTSKSENLSEHDDNWDSIDSDCDDDVLDEEGLFSYERWDSKNPIIYKPNTQREFFTFNGRWFQWSKDQRQNTDGRSIDRLVFVRCLGRSTEPIKEFLTHIRTWSRNKEVKATEVYRSSKRANERGVEWSRQSVRPSRPLDTVSLDDEQKTKIVADINEYLLPATARWYAVRGIPHRRGYLFHGPPGTGKTSLSFSLAGIFGLAIYCISLSEMALTESDLGTLFRRLPKRCIVLLEDIDSAGLRREDDALIPAIKSSDGSDSESGSGGKTTGASMSLISLAGLLNVIDGAGSHEVYIISSKFSNWRKIQTDLQ